jgi:FixJ family two-component response regulator
MVVVVDDDPAVRASVNRLLRASGYRVKTYVSAHQFAQVGRLHGPCCLILDVQMPDMDGLQFKQSLDRAGIRIPIIFITGFGNIPMGVHAIQDGAVDFLPKPFDADELLRAVDRALAADAQLLHQERERADLHRRFDSLTDREREVFFAVTSGLLNKQVGHELGVSEKTIKVHRGRVTEKMGAESLAALVRMADQLQNPAAPPGSDAASHWSASAAHFG